MWSGTRFICILLYLTNENPLISTPVRKLSSLNALIASSSVVSALADGPTFVEPAIVGEERFRSHSEGEFEIIGSGGFELSEKNVFFLYFFLTLVRHAVCSPGQQTERHGPTPISQFSNSRLVASRV